VGTDRKITVVTAVLNAAKDIEACILSVAGQSYPDKEHLFVDGASTDGTLDIIRRYAEKYPHISFMSEPDRGIYDAMNKGIDRALGEWIYFLGCDDLFYDDAVLADIFADESINKYDLVYGNVLWGDSGKIYDGKFSLLKLMEKNICHQAIFYSKRLFDRMGRYDTGYRIWADYLLNIRVFNDPGVNVAYRERTIARYGTSGSSSSQEDPDFVSRREEIFATIFPPEFIENRHRLQQLASECARQGHALAARDKLVAEQDEQIDKLSRRVTDGERQIVELKRLVAEKNTRIQALLNSFSWKMTAPVRRLADVASVNIARIDAAVAGLKKKLSSGRCDLPARIDSYTSWLEVNQWNQRREELLRLRLQALVNLPLLSVVMPVYNPPAEFLARAITSVTSQIYGEWELCIADDASTQGWVHDYLRKMSAGDARIKVIFRAQNGNISAATNSAAALAAGRHLVFLDQDDELTPDALGEIALYLAGRPDTDVLYSDDDKLDGAGRRFDPQFKPDWSPELLLSYMYLSHLFVVSKEMFDRVGGVRVGFEGSQDYDLALRATEQARHVGHIPLVLYHWRVLPGSTAASGDAKPASFSAGCRAVQEALDRRRIGASAYQPDWAKVAKCGIFSHAFPDTGPTVAILIPTRNRVEVLAKCIDSIKAKTRYRNYEIVVIDNESDDPATIAYLAALPDKVLRVGSSSGRFNFAEINNRAAAAVDAEFLLFLNNDTEVSSPEWLSQMVGYLQIDGVGGVGARLVFPDGRLQHAGIVHGYYNGMAGPAFKLLPSWHHGYLSYTKVARNYLAVTAACLLTRRSVFLDNGGFDAATFAVAYNDVDFCYRLVAKGLRMVYCPDAELVHHENYSRGGTDNPAEVAAFKMKYGGMRDPYYNPNLSCDDEQFAPAGSVTGTLPAAPVKALMCAFNLNHEGAPYSQFEMTRYLKDAGIVQPLVYSPVEGPLRLEYEAAGIPVAVFPHPLHGKTTATEYAAAISEFAAWITANGFELVYANTLQTFYAIAAAKEAGLPSIWNPRESEPWQTYFDFMGEAVARKALRCFQYPYKVVFVANATRNGCTPLDSRHNFTTVHNGLDLERLKKSLEPWPRPAARQELDLAEGELMLLLLGTVCERKGQLDLMEAIPLLSEEVMTRIRIFIVGDRPGDYSGLIHAALQALPESRRRQVTIVPETYNTALYYAAADIFVFTSRIESYPRVILEAMACNLPIIAAPVFGVAEQVQNNVNGLFYPPGDAAELARAISRLIEDDGERRMMAANSSLVLATLNNFQSMAEAYGRIFREAWLFGRPRGCAE